MQQCTFEPVVTWPCSHVRPVCRRSKVRLLFGELAVFFLVVNMSLTHTAWLASLSYSTIILPSFLCKIQLLSIIRNRSTSRNNELELNYCLLLAKYYIYYQKMYYKVCNINEFVIKLEQKLFIESCLKGKLIVCWPLTHPVSTLLLQ